MTKRINRRRFLQNATTLTGAALGMPYLVSSTALGKDGAVAPSEKIVMGCIGVGSMGGGHLRSFLAQEDVRIAAVCDLRESFRQRALSRVNRRYGDQACIAYNDYRELLGRKDIDAVTVVVPDHWHFLIALEAARRGKAMYCEKPLTMCVSDSKILREVVNRYGVVFQLGTQQRSDEKFRLACELVRNQRIGKLQTILVGSHPSITCPNQPLQPAPDKKQFDYDTWLGPSPWKPYTFHRCASRAEDTPGYWTHIYDYSLGGISGAWGIHHVDIAQWANDANNTGPLEISGWGRFPDDGLTDTALAWEVEHLYANGVRMIHMDTATSRQRAEQFKTHWGVGVLFQGSDGWVFVNRDFIKTEPASLVTTVFGQHETRLYQSNNHRRNFLDCVKTRRRTICPVDSAVRSDTVCHLDDIAIRLGRKLRWDPLKEQIIGDDQANRLLTRAKRSPWHI